MTSRCMLSGVEGWHAVGPGERRLELAGERQQRAFAQWLADQLHRERQAIAALIER